MDDFIYEDMISQKISNFHETIIRKHFGGFSDTSNNATAIRHFIHGTPFV